jgi:hypothetical protein
MMRSIVTRFRAYQLGVPGSSFSHFADGHFTVIEGRLTEFSKIALVYEMHRCGLEFADTLHITSWDADHCNMHELQELLDLVRPLRIECAGYNPYTDHGEGCLEIISAYRDAQESGNRVPTIKHITPRYIDQLEKAGAAAFKDTLYNPKHIDVNRPNNNSTVQHFRKGSFNVLSLGDVESPNISARYRTPTRCSGFPAATPRPGSTLRMRASASTLERPRFTEPIRLVQRLLGSVKRRDSNVAANDRTDSCSRAVGQSRSQLICPILPLNRVAHLANGRRPKYLRP